MSTLTPETFRALVDHIVSRRFFLTSEEGSSFCRQDRKMYNKYFSIHYNVELLDKDDDVEFKGHLAFSYQQLPVRAKRLQTKKHISSVATGMLNNEKGGIILMGVHDNK